MFWMLPLLWSFMDWPNSFWQAGFIVLVYLLTASTWISVVVIGYWVVAYAWVGVVVRCHEPIALCAEVCDGDRALTIFVALCMLGPGPCP